MFKDAARTPCPQRIFRLPCRFRGSPGTGRRLGGHVRQIRVAVAPAARRPSLPTRRPALRVRICTSGLRRSVRPKSISAVAETGWPRFGLDSAVLGHSPSRPGPGRSRSDPGPVVSRRRGWRVSQVRTRNLLGLDRRSPGRPGSPWTLPAPAASTPPRSGSHRNDITPPDNPSAWGLSPASTSRQPNTRTDIRSTVPRRGKAGGGADTLSEPGTPHDLSQAPTPCPSRRRSCLQPAEVPHAARPTPPPAHGPPDRRAAVRRRPAAAGGGWRGWRSARVVHQSSVATAAGSRSSIGARRQAGTTHGYDRTADFPCARRGSRRSRQV